ncbi:MAG: outer membrane beta-barrel protein [Pseudomonadota bacterium]
MKLTTHSIALLAIGLFPTSGFADFSGAYGGLAINSIDGNVDFINDRFLSDAFFLPDEGVSGLSLNPDTAISGFGGYQIQTGNLVYGGEIAITSSADGGFSGIQFEGMDTLTTEIKGRVGYALNDRVMAYGTAGFSRVSVDLGALEDAGASDDLDADGFVIGAGIDYLATDNIMLGVEFTNRQVGGNIPVDISGVEDLDIDLDANALGLRAAFKF